MTAADEQARAHNDAGLESQATNPGGARPSYDWEAGRSTTYRLDWDIDMGSSAQASDRIELDIDGFWTVRGAPRLNRAEALPSLIGSAVSFLRRTAADDHGRTARAA